MRSTHTGGRRWCTRQCSAASPGTSPPCTTPPPPMLQLLQCFMLPSHTPLPCLAIAAPHQAAIFSTWHNVPFNTQECLTPLTPNFGPCTSEIQTDIWAEIFLDFDLSLKLSCNAAVLPQKNCCVLEMLFSTSGPGYPIQSYPVDILTVKPQF